MKDLQAKHKEWSERNFGNMTPKTECDSLHEVQTIAAAVGCMAHHALKAYQGIRGDIHQHRKGFEQGKRLVITRAAYAEDLLEIPSVANKKLQPLIGVIEEVGELCTATYDSEIVDAVGDITLYLIDYCNAAGIDFEDAVRTTAAKVHARDWTKNSVNGEVSE